MEQNIPGNYTRALTNKNNKGDIIANDQMLSRRNRLYRIFYSFFVRESILENTFQSLGDWQQNQECFGSYNWRKANILECCQTVD